jgi:hypothetical protein
MAAAKAAHQEGKKAGSIDTRLFLISRADSAVLHSLPRRPIQNVPV